MQIGSSNVTINGIIDGSNSPGSNTYAVSTNASAVIDFTGNIIGKAGGTVAAVAGSGTWNITGNVDANVFRAINGTHTVNLTGNVTASNTSSAINCSRLNINGVLIDSEFFSAITVEKLSPIASGSLIWNTYDEFDALRPIYTANELTGYPTEDNVFDSVQYGPSDEFTGTLSPVSVDSQQLADAIFIAMGNSTLPLAERWRNVATVQSTGDQIDAIG
jgi:hypothetical protein